MDHANGEGAARVRACRSIGLTTTAPGWPVLQGRGQAVALPTRAGRYAGHTYSARYSAEKMPPGTVGQ